MDVSDARRTDMIVQAAPVVPENKNYGVVPVDGCVQGIAGAAGHALTNAIHDVGDPRWAQSREGGVLRAVAAMVGPCSIRGDKTDLGEGAGLNVLHDLRRIGRIVPGAHLNHVIKVGIFRRCDPTVTGYR